MKRNHRIFAAAALLLAAILAFAGCASLIAANVGDRVITVQQLENGYKNSYNYASLYGQDTSTEEGRLAFLNFMLDSMIQNELLAYKAEQAGVTLTDEERAEAEKAAKASYDAFYQEYVDYAKQSGTSDVQAYANKMLAEALAQNGMTVSKIKAEYLQDQIDSRMIAKHKEQLLDGVAPTADELKAMYDEELAAQQKAIEEDPASYFTYELYHNYGYGYMPLVVPEGLIRVRQILVEDEETANEVMKKLKEGKDFEVVLAEYNTDPGMKNEQYADGYLVGKGASYIDEFLNAALALTEDGELSPIVKSDSGYHIIKRIRAEEARVIPYEEVQESFDKLATSNFISKYYNDIVTGWMESDDVVRHEDTYASLAK